MAKCGCAGSTACACAVQAGSAVAVSGNGSGATPYIVSVPIDPAATNLLELAAGGLSVDCAAVAACVAEQTPTGEIVFSDTPGVNLTRTGSGVDGDPYVVTADLIPVSVQSAAASFTRNLAGAAGVYEEVTELPGVTIAVPGTYWVEYTARGSATIPAGSGPLSTSTSAAIARNDVIVGGSETQLVLVSQGTASSAQPALQGQASSSWAGPVVCAAGDVLSLYAMRQPVASGTNSIISNTDGRCRIAAHRIGA